MYSITGSRNYFCLNSPQGWMGEKSWEFFAFVFLLLLVASLILLATLLPLQESLGTGSGGYTGVHTGLHGF